MLEIIKIGTAGFVIYQGFRVLGKHEYASLIGFVVLLNVGFSIFLKVGGWYNSFMNSKIIELLEKIF